MEHDYWHGKWAKNDLGFHKSEPHPKLVDHVGTLRLQPDARVFVPLCGKTRDIPWLLEQGFRVAGAELNRSAIEQLFDDMGVTPQITEQGPLTRFSADHVEIFVGDIFALDPPTLGPIDAIYDRAALVALPGEMRQDYAPHLLALCGPVRQLLISFEYDATGVTGPPFPVTGAEIARLYSTHTASLLQTSRLDGLKGVTPVHELAWHLAPPPE